ncbi:virulence plasmid 28 protein [Pseudomonas sp. SWRI153]|uniref:Virulence plasmid 28 protein n=1 Tax=Pseudomonas khorasanensis TaxID=2745508 RepID=A0A923F1E4_9PSED|nr:Tc toxin subunit A [Pseudomonas khorasanensis]MBV4485405.1 virulence plasmid 28 protein [Pseudomonas khorasanensis]
MDDLVIRPTQHLFQQVFSEEQRTSYAGLNAYIEAGGSIFPLVEKGVQGLVKDFSISPDDARQFLRRANSMAIYVRRQFIEHSLRSDNTEGAGPSSGLLAMVQGPNFERLFSPDFDSACPPQALESLASPVAYLIELMRWIDQRIESAPTDILRLPLHDRRTDLKPLLVDFNAVHQSVSSVDIIVSVLEKFIKKHAPSVELEQAMIEARYPNGLPYYQHWVTLDGVARHHGLSVGNFAHMVDLSFPYFLQDQAWDDDAGRALAHASRLGPYQRQLLTVPAATIGDREDFYWLNFGADKLSWQNLNQVPFFGERTKLDTPGLEALLSVRGFAPVRSANVEYPTAVPTEPESGRSGSVYLNANTHPAVSITGSGGSSFLHRLSASPDDASGLARYDRMNRKLRLDQWLELPSEQVDALLVAAIKAEVRSGAEANLWWITEKTMHALGLFQSLRERYGCTAADFAVFLDELSLYGRGEALSQFDQVFNDRGKYPDPFKLDSGEFPVSPEQGAFDLTVSQLCSALAIDPETYHYLAVAIAAAHDIKNGKLLRNAAIISSFYRLVKLPRLLGITPVEGVVMLRLLGGETWVNGLAGVPKIHPARVKTPDVLNLIYALHSCVGWCSDRNIEVLWMLQHVAPPQTLAASDIDKRLFEQVLNLLPAALFTNSALLAAGVPELPGQSWLDLLTVLVDRDGLVVSHAGTDADYLIHARAQLDKAVIDGLGDKYELERPAIVEKMLGVLLRAKDAQVSVVKECLAVYAGVDAEQALQVLMWAKGTVQQFLRQVLKRAVTGVDGSVRGRNEEPDPLLALLADVRRRSAVVAELELSAVLLQDYLAYGHGAWIDQEDLEEKYDKYAFNMHALYYLTSLTRAFELSKQPAQKFLDYLREVNALPQDLSGAALRLAQQVASIRLAEFFDWSVQEVRECVNRIDPLKILKNLKQLDLLMRIRVLAKHTGMDALTIFLIGNLPEAVDKPAYKEAAELALLSLSESAAPLVNFSEDLKQLVTLTCVVDNTEVVANKPGEKITFTVTLTDSGGTPLSGVNVYWSATLGSIATVATEMDGTVKAEFIPGSVMGTDTPLFWLDLFDAESAPTINVVADALTLQFPPPLMARVPLGPVAYGQEIELYATLRDDYGNLGKDSLVRWQYEAMDPGDEEPLLIVRPAQSQTNQDGFTHVFISSLTGGTFEINVFTEAGESSSFFEYITFAGPEDK